MKTPFTFPTIVDATKRLDRYIAQSEYAETYQYEISAAFDGERKVIGFTIRVKDVDGFGIGYVGPDINALSDDEKAERMRDALHSLMKEFRDAGRPSASRLVAKVGLEIDDPQAARLYDIILGL